MCDAGIDPAPPARSIDMTNDNSLSALSDGFAAAVERVSPALVTVSARRRFPATGVVWLPGGLIVTADHAIEQEDSILVAFDGDEEATEAELIGRDAGSDLALLRVNREVDAAERAPDDAARIGSLVLAVGRPGATPEVSLGALSAFLSRRTRRRGRRRDEGAASTSAGVLYRTDTTLFPGFSGGPLIDARGRVLGINTSRGRAGGGFTIPHATVTDIVNDLMQHGRVRRAYLGIGSQVVQLPTASVARLGSDLQGIETGLLIVGIEAGSPAEHGGLLVGDILVGFAGAPVTRTEELQAQLGSDTVGVSAELTVLRGGEPATITVTPGERA
jgi:S1-C subfamily serine protease